MRETSENKLHYKKKPQKILEGNEEPILCATCRMILQRIHPPNNDPQLALWSRCIGAVGPFGLQQRSIGPHLWCPPATGAASGEGCSRALGPARHATTVRKWYVAKLGPDFMNH